MMFVFFIHSLPKYHTKSQIKKYASADSGQVTNRYLN